MSLREWVEENGPVTVTLVGEDGNAFSIMGRVARALSRAGAPQEVIDEYLEEAQSGDYNHLLVTTMKIVEEGDE